LLAIAIAIIMQPAKVAGMENAAADSRLSIIFPGESASNSAIGSRLIGRRYHAD
jgi:hypothetical protein